jgi:hypothetical protein
MSKNVRPQFVESNGEDPKNEFWTLEDMVEELVERPLEIVPGFVSRNLTLIQGESAAGKSILASELATAYSNETPFLGKFEINVNPLRPNVCYVDQDTFDPHTVKNRFVSFGCNPKRLHFPRFWFRLDDEDCMSKMVEYLEQYKVGLLILDSIHAFHKLRDRRNLEHLRDGFRRIIEPGTAIVILSHITKSSSASDIDAARGFGLVEATDYTHGVSKVSNESFRVNCVKARYGPKSKPFLFAYSGTSRPVKETEQSLEELIIQHLLDVGEKGTTISAMRKAVGGDNHAVSELVKSMPEVYADGKRGPGSHIWHVNHKRETVPDEVVSPDKDPGSFDEPDDASNQRTCLLEIDDDDDDDCHESPNAGNTSFIEFDDDVSTYDSPA